MGADGSWITEFPYTVDWVTNTAHEWVVYRALVAEPGLAGPLRFSFCTCSGGEPFVWLEPEGDKVTFWPNTSILYQTKGLDELYNLTTRMWQLVLSIQSYAPKTTSDNSMLALPLRVRWWRVSYHITVVGLASESAMLYVHNVSSYLSPPQHCTTGQL